MSGSQKVIKQADGKLGIGDLLRDLRRQKKLTISEVAERTKVSEETIRRLELDKFEPKLSTLEVLSDFYRTDLIEMIARRRGFNSLFSEELISEINQLINAFDVEALKRYADIKIAELSGSMEKGSAVLIQFLYALKSLKMDYKGNHASTIANLETILLSISPKYTSTESPDYPITVEMTCILYLSYVYRQAKLYDKAVSLLKVTCERIRRMPFLNDRYSDYLAATYINLAYVYHSMGAHQLVVESVDACISDNKVSFTRIAMAQLLYRKGIALVELQLANGLSPQMSEGESYLRTSLSLMSPAERARLAKLVKEQYGISLGITF